MGCAFSIRLGITAALVALSLAGCGRKGPLEPPAGVPQTQTPAAAQATQTRVLQDESDPGLLQNPNVVYEDSAIAKLNSQTKNPARPINAPPLAQPSTFFLDPLVR